jgi:hypothetical protein
MPASLIVGLSRPSRKSADGQRSRQSSNSSGYVLVLIGIFKLIKALLLIAIGIGVIKLLHKDIAGTVMHWIEALRVDPENRYVHRLLV